MIIPLFIGILRPSFIPGNLAQPFFSLKPPEVKVPQDKGLVHLAFSLILSAFPFSWLYHHFYGWLKISLLLLLDGFYFIYFLLVGARRVEFLFYKSEDKMRDL